MKKIITMLVCTAAFTTAFSQSKHREYNNTNNTGWNSNTSERGYQRDDDHRNNSIGYQNNDYNNRQRDIQVQRISQQFDFRIQQVMYNRSMNPRQKQYAVRELQAQKARQINSIYAQYANSYNNNRRGNYDNDRDDRDSHFGNDRFNR